MPPHRRRRRRHYRCRNDRDDRLQGCHAAHLAVLVIERDQYGTMCARVGCMPSKPLIAGGKKAHSLTQAARFGVLAGDVRTDGRKVMERVRRERDRFVGTVSSDGLATHSVDRFVGSPNRIGDKAKVSQRGAIAIAIGNLRRSRRVLNHCDLKTLL